jgi:tyrosinase
MAKPSIAIIGAGIGGLTLGWCFLQRGIPAVLYERTAVPYSHNYGITLHEHAYRPLQETLEVDKQAFKSRLAVDAAVGGS